MGLVHGGWRKGTAETSILKANEGRAANVSMHRLMAISHIRKRGMCNHTRLKCLIFAVLLIFAGL